MNKQDVLNVTSPPNSLADQATNALILGGFTFFSTWAGQAATGINPLSGLGLVASFIAAGLSFFGSLVTQRSIQKKNGA